ncbi:hypothetical protein BDN70DRAFT_902252, partial [Pholiota conissans]
DFFEASKEESRGVPFSNPAIRALRKHISAIRTRVPGTDESRAEIRSKIWGMNLAFNPPSLWITINPADTQDPIAQVLAGVKIDLDNFCNTAGPDNDQRGVNITSDAYAAAKFFHFTIETVLDCLFGIRKKREGRSSEEGGILGKVQGYIGTVEAQGRGTLHLHMLIWLKDAPSSKLMEHALKNENFRQKIKTYIKAIIRADIDELSHKDVLRHIPRVSAVSYSRPVDPRLGEFAEKAEAHERQLARAVQLHDCKISTCLKLVNGRMQCKRRAPFQLATDDWVHENGEWGPKRFCSHFNNWNSTLLRAVRSNHDVKLIMNGGMTKSITWYITNYATKKQQKSSNITAILAKKHAFHHKIEKHTTDVNLARKRLIQRCALAISNCHEFSAPEAFSNIMNWLDRYESHNFAAIYLDSAIMALKQAFPELEHTHISESLASTGDVNPNRVDDTASTLNNGAATISFVSDSIQLRDQLKDYKFRGVALEHMNLYEFIIETYEFTLTSKDIINNQTVAETAGAGRQRSIRIPYMEEALKPKRCRIIRAPGHDTVPRIVGKWFSRNDEPAYHELYCASMMMMFKPWRSIKDLKVSGELFQDKWNSLQPTLPLKLKRVVDNIQYYHECADSARERREAEQQGTNESFEGGSFEFEADEEINENGEEDDRYIQNLTEDDVVSARENKLAAREKIFGRVGLQIGSDVEFFPELEEFATAYRQPSQKAELGDLGTIQQWAKQLTDTTRRQLTQTGRIDLSSTSMAEVPAVEVNSNNETNESNSTSARNYPEIPLVEPSVNAVEPASVMDNTHRPKLAQLNKEQKVAHDIVERKLRQIIAGNDTPQLKMLILGHGGTGKSHLISTITETFEYLKSSSKLAKCATSGIAASGIKGQTLHS